MQSLLKQFVIAVLTFEAKMVLRRHAPLIIAVTGSVGKTTTKDAIFSALAPSRAIRKNEKSFNSELGVPLTILGETTQWGSAFGWGKVLLAGARTALFSREYPDWLVLEAGVDRPGDMGRLCSWMKPDIVVLTRFPDLPVHVEQFSSPEAVIAEKRRLVRALVPDGVLVVNADDPQTFAEKVREGQRKFSFGVGPNADVKATHVQPVYENTRVTGMQCEVEYAGEHVSLVLNGVLGIQPVYAALAAITVAVTCELSLQAAVDGLAAHTGAPGRMRILAGKAGSTIIDDSYNSSPAALEEALVTLKRLRTKGKKFAILGDMLELGEYTVPAHKEAAQLAVDSADVLVTVGVRARVIAKTAREAGMPENAIFECKDAYQAGDVVSNLLAEGDVVLVKGSQSCIRLERAVKLLMAEPERAYELLVRQDAAWENKP